MTGRILSPAKNLPANDIVMTPPELAKSIIDQFGPWGSVLDPCRGSGAFFNNYPDDVVKYWCELSEQTDFVNFQGHVNWIVTNPPWSKIPFFLEKGMQVSDNIVYLAPITNFVTKRRLRLIRENKFGIKEIFGVDTPKHPWPQSGFQLAAIYFQKNYNGPTFMTGTLG